MIDLDQKALVMITICTGCGITYPVFVNKEQYTEEVRQKVGKAVNDFLMSNDITVAQLEKASNTEEEYEKWTDITDCCFAEVMKVLDDYWCDPIMLEISDDISVGFGGLMDTDD